MKDLFIYIPVLLPSLNRWNSMHHMQKHKLKKEAEDIIYAELESAVDCGYSFKKVMLNFQCILGTETGNEITKDGKKRKKRNRNSRDIINNAPTIKLVEDCIVRSGILEDDTVDFVVGHKIMADKVDRDIDGSGIMIIIEEYSEKPKPSIYKHFKDIVKNANKYDKPSKTNSPAKRKRINKKRSDKKTIEDVVKKLKQQCKKNYTADELRNMFK